MICLHSFCSGEGPRPVEDGIGEVLIDQGILVFSLSPHSERHSDWMAFGSFSPPVLILSSYAARFDCGETRKVNITRSGNQPWILRSGTYCVENKQLFITIALDCDKVVATTTLLACRITVLCIDKSCLDP